MEGKRLSHEEIKRRLIELRNARKLYGAQKLQNQRLKEENRALKEQISALSKTINKQQETILNLTLQVSELRTIVFGKKRRKKKISDDDLTPPNQRSPRSKDSYKRPLPKEEEITERRHHSISKCPCGSKFAKKEMAVYYEEDIPLPVKKTVIEHTVEKGYCPHCRKWHSAIPLPSSKAVIGNNARKLITVLSVINLNSFSQIETLLLNIFSFKISQGEIAAILAKEANYLRPHYERLKQSIRGAPVKGLDETGWRIFSEDGSGNYAWILNDFLKNRSIFLLGESRGKGNIDTLLGENHKGYTVSDDYGAYNHLKKRGSHQLCFAHPHRKLRDLAGSDDLGEKELLVCREAYIKFAGIYGELKENRDTLKYGEFKERLSRLATAEENDPRKLVQIKAGIKRNIPSYLTCLKDGRIPLDNNQTERSLRHLVLKRKVSFGSLNKKTAENTAILLSVLLSLKQRNKDGFFAEYLEV